MNEQMIEPCPFCGGERMKIESCYVRCQSCCADGPVMDAMPDGAEEDATGAIWNGAIVALWNRRAAHSIMAAKIAELEEALDMLCDSVEREDEMNGSISGALMADMREARAALAPYPERRHD